MGGGLIMKTACGADSALNDSDEDEKAVCVLLYMPVNTELSCILVYKYTVVGKQISQYGLGTVLRK